MQTSKQKKHSHNIASLAFAALLLISQQVEAACDTGVVFSDVQGLAFGDFASTSGGSVSIDTVGGASSSGDVFLFPSTRSQAIFQITRCPADNFVITLPAAASIKFGNTVMNLSNFVSDPVGSGVADATGFAEVHVGATLEVPAAPKEGNYKGTFDVIVDFL